MNLKRVSYFLAVARHLHFGRAAEEMNVVQPAISQQIRQFEQEVGAELFERNGNGVRLTEVGRQLLPRCQRLIEMASDTDQLARQLAKGAIGRVRFGLVDNAICTLLPLIAEQFKATFPAIQLEIRALDSSDQVAPVIERDIDVALVSGPIHNEELESETVIVEPLVAALPAGHPLARQPVVNLAQLSAERFVVFEQHKRSRIRDLTVSACAAAGFSPEIAQEARHTPVLLALVIAGIGVTMLPRWIARDMHPHQIAYRDLAPVAPAYELVMVWRRDSSNMAISNLREIARSVGQEISVLTSQWAPK